MTLFSILLILQIATEGPHFDSNYVSLGLTTLYTTTFHADWFPFVHVVRSPTYTHTYIVRYFAYLASLNLSWGWGAPTHITLIYIDLVARNPNPNLTTYLTHPEPTSSIHL